MKDKAGTYITHTSLHSMAGRVENRRNREREARDRGRVREASIIHADFLLLIDKEGHQRYARSSACGSGF